MKWKKSFFFYTFWCSYEWFPHDGITFSFCNKRTHRTISYFHAQIHVQASIFLLFILCICLLFWSPLKTHENKKVFETWLHFTHPRSGTRTFSPSLHFLQSNREQDQVKCKMIKGRVLSRMSLVICLCRSVCGAKHRCKLYCLLKWMRGTMWKLDSVHFSFISSSNIVHHFMVSTFFSFAFLLPGSGFFFSVLWLPFFFHHCVHSFPFIIVVFSCRSFLLVMEKSQTKNFVTF